MTITQLPTAPSRNDPSDVFNERADDWVAALPPWTDEVNALSVEIDANATIAENSAVSASADADIASASAVTAINAPGTSATSTTSVLIGLGSKSFTVQAGKDFVVGMLMIAADDSAPTTNLMIGGILSYNSGSGALVLDIDSFDGSGTISSWTISITGRAGSDGSANIVEDTTPQLGGQLDVNGNSIGDGTRELLSFTEDSSSVNNINITNAITGSGPIVSSVGDDNDIDLNISGKGTGKIKIDSPIVPNNNYIGSSKGSDLATSSFDISAISELKKSKSVASEDTSPKGIRFNNNGSKVYIIGSVNDSIYEYNLSINYDISTLSSVQVTKSISSDDSIPEGFTFNNDGSKIYVVGAQNSSIYEYNLSTPFDLSTLSTSQVTHSVLSEDLSPKGIEFNNDGSKLFMVGAVNLSIYEYNLNTPFDMNTISSVQVTKSIASENISPLDIGFNLDGSKIYMIGNNLMNINEYNLSISFDLSTLSTVQNSRFLSSEDASHFSFAFDNIGSKFFTVGLQNDLIYEYNIGESFNLSALSSIQETQSISSEDTDPQGIAFNNDGTKIYMIGKANDSIHEYNLTTPFDLSTKTTVQVTKSVSSEDTSPSSVIFNNDGSKMYITGTSSDSLHEYNLSTNFDLSTKSSVITTKSVSTEDSQPTGIAFNNDGSKIYMVGSITNFVYEYNLLIPFDLSSKSMVQASADISSDDLNHNDIAFSNDGLKLFTIGSTNDYFYEYGLTTAFDLSTLTSLKVKKSINDSTPRGLAFNKDGSKIFLIGGGSDQIYEYNLNTTLLTIGKDGDYFNVSGTSGFSGVVVDTNRKFTLQFNDSLIIISGPSLSLNNAGNDYTTSSGDIIDFMATDQDKVVGIISKKDGTSVATQQNGSWVLIGNLDADNNTTMTITGLDNTYHTYAIGLTDIESSDASDHELLFRTGTSSGIDSGVDDYGYHVSDVSSSLVTYNALANNSSNSIVIASLVSVLTNKTSAMLFLQRSGDNNIITISGVANHISVLATGVCQGGHIIGTRSDPTNVDRVQISLSIGNILSGKMSLWGII